jgi:outer membrane protein OmpA-like peptidoglycan-associated protein
VFSYLKKYVTDNKVDAPGFMSLLGGQAEHLQGTLNDKVTGALGLGSAGSFLSNAVDSLSDKAEEVWDVMEGAGKSAFATASAAAHKVGEEAYEMIDELDDEGSPAKKYLLWGLLGVGALAALLAYRGCSSDVEEAASKAASTASSATQQAVDTAKSAADAAKDATAAAGAAVDTGAQAAKDAAATTADAAATAATATADAAKDAAAAAGNAAGTAAEAMKSIELPGGAKLEVAAGSPVEGLYNIVKDPASDITQALHLNGLNFETASARITKDSMQIVEQVVAVLKAYPTVAIRVEGHTDNAGKADANKKLSTARAQSVKLALAKKGIGSKRIDAQGFGQEKPIADNATEDGKAQNRRVDVVVTKR